MRCRRPEVSLVLLGLGRDGPALPRTPGVRAVGHRPDKELALWYAAAEALVAPSLSEGFGLPALEAMACATPVIASRRPAPREVVGDAGLLVEPRDSRDLAQAMELLLTDRELAGRLSGLGLRRAGQFSWERAADTTVEVYREAREAARAPL